MSFKRKFPSVVMICLFMLSIFAVFLQVVPPVSASSTLGTNASLTGTISPNANYIYFYGPYTAQTTGPISTLKNYIYSGDANAFAKMAIYSDNSNQPGNYLASTSQLNIYGLGSWYNFTGIYYEVTQNTKYWLAVVTNASFFQGLSNSGSWIQYQQASTYPTFVNSASATSGSTYNAPCVYGEILSDPFTVSSISAIAYVGLQPTFSALWSTNETLSHYIVETNRTGSPVNETAQAFSNTWSNYTASWSLSNIGNLQWKIYANTTLGLWANTGLQNSTVSYTEFTISGPYIEDNGAVANEVVAGTVYFSNGMSQVFSLDGTSGSAQSYAINPAYTPISVTWQAIANYSYTRTYYLTGTTGANITVFVPNPASTPQLYQFTISDFSASGITNPYIATTLTVGGNLTTGTYTIERKPLTVGTVSMIMEQWHSYTLQIQCDQGIYNVLFSAESTFLTNLNIPSGAFPNSNVSYPIAYAERTNSTAITITYSDTKLSTTTLNVLVSHTNGLTTVIDYTSNTPANSQTFIWNNAATDTTYFVNVTAVSNGVTYPYGFILSAAAPSNPFENLLDWLGPTFTTLPHITIGWPEGIEPSQLFATIIIIAALCIGSFRNAGASCLISALVGGLMIIMGWWQSAIPIWSLSVVIAVIIVIDEWRQSNGGYIAT